MTTDGHLFVAFTPDAIQAHYECYYDADSPLPWRRADERRKVFEFVMNADDDTLRTIGEIAINDESLWTAFDRVLIAAVEEVMQETEDAKNAHPAARPILPVAAARPILRLT